MSYFKERLQDTISITIATLIDISYIIVQLEHVISEGHSGQRAQCQALPPEATG